MSKIYYAVLASTMAIGLGSAGAQAASPQTANFDVTLTIEAACTIAAAPLDFGTQGVLAVDVPASNDLTVTCSNTTPYTIGLSAGTATGSTVEDRLLAAGAVTVAYQLYSDASHTQVWGDTGGGDEVSGVGSGAAQPIPVYGLVPSQATPAPGTYTSTVTATISF